MNVFVITYPVPKYIYKLVDINPDDYVIAVDQALDATIKQGIKVDVALGDFDSLENHELLKKVKTIKLPTEKDYTDTFEALKYAYNLEGVDQVYVLGGLGGNRFEHNYVHLLFFKHFKHLILMNDETTIQCLKKGVYHTDFKGYISIFALKPSVITLEGFKYPLTQYELKINDPIGISNEVLDKQGSINLHKGEILVMLTQK